MDAPYFSALLCVPTFLFMAGWIVGLRAERNRLQKKVDHQQWFIDRARRGKTRPAPWDDELREEFDQLHATVRRLQNENIALEERLFLDRTRGIYR